MEHKVKLTSKLPTQQRLQIPRLRGPKAPLAQQILLEGASAALNDTNEEAEHALATHGGDDGGHVVEAQWILSYQPASWQAVMFCCELRIFLFEVLAFLLFWADGEEGG
jgi:hypothetical protein